MTPPAPPAVEWIIDDALVDYPNAIARMEARVEAIRAGTAAECVWLLEHPPLYTAGTSANPADLLDPRGLPVYSAGRGGQYTYHGPGQRVAYVMLDLDRLGRDVRKFVWRLEDWLIRALGDFNVHGERRDDRPGVWVRRTDLNAPDKEDKIAAIGVRLRKWVSFHGVALNVEPDLAAYRGVTPCGIRDHGVTSLTDLGIPAAMTDVDLALKAHFEAAFDPDAAIETTR